MDNFEPDKAVAFLEAGFKQIGLSPSEDVLTYATQKLGGVVGWLTLFGARCRDHRRCDKEIVDEVAVEGGKLARRETLKLVRLSHRYSIILNFLARVETASWTQIKAALEAEESRSLPNPTVADILNKLVRTGFILKKDRRYTIVDPLLRYGLLGEPLPTK